jgi:signal transduction histidine kinase
MPSNRRHEKDPAAPAAPARPAREQLAQMRHDIRTPLNAVMGLATILSFATNLTPRQQEIVETLKTSAEDLQRQVENLLDYSRKTGG